MLETRTWKIRNQANGNKRPGTEGVMNRTKTIARTHGIIGAMTQRGAQGRDSNNLMNAEAFSLFCLLGNSAYNPQVMGWFSLQIIMCVCVFQPQQASKHRATVSTATSGGTPK